MDLAALVHHAARRGASDLHIEAGLPLALRVRGSLRTEGRPLAPSITAALADELLDAAGRRSLAERGSVDVAAHLAGRRCRINVLRTSRGTGLAVRLLSDDLVTLDKLNLHPQLKRLTAREHGLIIVSGPTGSGKTSTQAAMLQEINLSRAAHIVTIEQPIEYDLAPMRAYIRQREVGRDTPSFGQALLDALREDPDVLMVGEMRDRETMRLTLDACETGHLVLATLHSATCGEALQRIVAAFPAEEQAQVCAQLADVLVAVVCQRLTWHGTHELQVPELEILMGTGPVAANVRQGQFFKLQTVLTTGAKDGQWTRERYRRWLEGRTDFHRPETSAPVVDRRDELADAAPPGPLPVDEGPAVATPPRPPPAPTADDAGDRPEGSDVIVIDPDPGSLADILGELEQDEPPGS